ncbi:MAG TPA: HoxN/HupN/NixA family nickel/cobalt transporter [Chloroflexota bacterium]|nr:HoxN/HupN/NixA family nickel/cobalt transporter [Chloroflexota bacterium]
MRPVPGAGSAAGWVRSLRAAWDQAPPDVRRRLILLYSLILGLNAGAWTALLLSSVRYGLLLGLAPVAYGFGLRHAVDADHIAAIDNTTRKLMRDGQKPVGVGFFFSLGHSTVVFALSVFIALSAAFVKAKLPQLQSAGALIGTSVSGVFLLVIAAINSLVLLEIYRSWRHVRDGRGIDELSLEEQLQARGFLARVFRPLLSSVSHSGNMYLIGILFGLGFDTASEVGILGMSATAGATGMPVWLILLLPLLFVAGMTLIDTTDGVAMLGAYGWAQVQPVRKLYYNLNITLVSVLVAFAIGATEILHVVGSETGLGGPLFSMAAGISINSLGFYVIGLFLAGWIVSAAVFKLRGLDRHEYELVHLSQERP